MTLTIDVWRQDGPDVPGRFERHQVTDATPEMSLLELLDRLNDQLVGEGREPVAFDHDCREGICGTCGVTVDGRPHGPVPNTPTCHQHVRSFADGDRVTLEPFRAAGFRVVRDLVVDRSALDRIIAAGGTVSVDTGTAPDADAQPVHHDVAEQAMDFAACIGCGACVAACPNAAAHLFTGAKLAQLALLPQGAVERTERAQSMTAVMEEHFGSCTTYGECVEVCPAGIPLVAIARLNREVVRSRFGRRRSGRR
ncbi:succinate dehydrogenase/fumarate reductase iron-sulfur subunit [Euzebya sp.]|uniref:succinate dehydrogenase/fumarate reductase iron-sulfur subunit n=1 Tax=Euzebya sp. TaxID=1971409 RepID=UPI003513CB5A